MAWGLDGVQLSNRVRAAYVDDAGDTGLIGIIINYFGSYEAWLNGIIDNAGVSPYYDFYITRDNPYESVSPRDYNGYIFNQEIVSTLLSLYTATTSSNTVKNAVNLNVMLNQDPVSAISYCYNKNKRQSDGSILSTEHNWYLPAIDEIEEITYSGYSDFAVFQNKLYWSCQPAYLAYDLVTKRNSWGTYYAYGSYMVDDINRARSTKIERDATTTKNVSSAVDGTEGTLTIELSALGRYQSKSESSNEGKDNYTNHDKHLGNNARTGVPNRIRCVRNSGLVSDLSSSN